MIFGVNASKSHLKEDTLSCNFGWDKSFSLCSMAMAKIIGSMFYFFSSLLVFLMFLTPLWFLPMFTFVVWMLEGSCGFILLLFSARPFQYELLYFLLFCYFFLSQWFLEADMTLSHRRRFIPKSF